MQIDQQTVPQKMNRRKMKIFDAKKLKERQEHNQKFGKSILKKRMYPESNLTRGLGESDYKMLIDQTNQKGAKKSPSGLAPCAPLEQEDDELSKSLLN